MLELSVDMLELSVGVLELSVDMLELSIGVLELSVHVLKPLIGVLMMRERQPVLILFVHCCFVWFINCAFPLLFCLV